jgi:hypothetical protein
MAMILTDKQNLTQGRPTRLDLLRELHTREALAGEKVLRQELQRLERGAEGEEILLDYFKKYGEEHWTVMKNIWLEFEGIFECDFLLLTAYNLHALEVKNYTGTFELKNNIGRINGTKYSKHPLTQGQNLVFNLEKLLAGTPGEMKVKGAVTFVGADNTVNIYDEVEDIQVIRRNKLRKYIYGIANAERYTNGYPLDQEKIIQTIKKYEIECPYPPEKDIPKEVFEKVRGGIYCCHCSNFNVKIGVKYVSCSCGMHEPRDEAIVRTICEYGVLHYKEDFTSSKLVKFFNGDISRSNIIKILNKYFEKIGKYRNSKYLNHGITFIQLYKQFGFTKPKKFLFFK